MDKNILRNCYVKSVQLLRAKEAKELFDEFMKKHSICNKTTLAVILECSRSYVYEMEKGIRPISKKILKRILRCNQLLLDRKKVEEYL